MLGSWGMIFHAPAVATLFLQVKNMDQSQKNAPSVRRSYMAKYIIHEEKQIPTCTICGRPIPKFAPKDVEIDMDEIRHCYFCGSPMERFYYPKGE